MHVIGHVTVVNRKKTGKNIPLSQIGADSSTLPEKLLHHEHLNQLQMIISLMNNLRGVYVRVFMVILHMIKT
jgi:hypothetical protein